MERTDPLSTNVTEPVTKRAIELVVGDRIDREQLPRLFGTGDPEIVFVKDHRHRRESFVFVVVAYDDGYHDSTSFLSGAEIKVLPAVDPLECQIPGCTPHLVAEPCPDSPEPIVTELLAIAPSADGVAFALAPAGAVVDPVARAKAVELTEAVAADPPRDRRTCVDPGDQEHDHEACKDVVAEEREREAAFPPHGWHVRGCKGAVGLPCTCPRPSEAPAMAASGLTLAADQSRGPLAGTTPVVVYFSFGWGQTDPASGKKLIDHYVTVVAPTYEECREAMCASRFGRNWSMDYLAGRDKTTEAVSRWTEHEVIVAPGTDLAEAALEAASELLNRDKPECACAMTEASFMNCPVHGTEGAGDY